MWEVASLLSGHMTNMPQEHLVQGSSKPHGYRVSAKGYPDASRERGPRSRSMPACPQGGHSAEMTRGAVGGGLPRPTGGAGGVELRRETLWEAVKMFWFCQGAGFRCVPGEGTWDRGGGCSCSSFGRQDSEGRATPTAARHGHRGSPEAGGLGRA